MALPCSLHASSASRQSYLGFYHAVRRLTTTAASSPAANYLPPHASFPLNVASTVPTRSVASKRLRPPPSKRAKVAKGDGIPTPLSLILARAWDLPLRSYDQHTLPQDVFRVPITNPDIPRILAHLRQARILISGRKVLLGMTSFHTACKLLLCTPADTLASPVLDSGAVRCLNEAFSELLPAFVYALQGDLKPGIKRVEAARRRARWGKLPELDMPIKFWRPRVVARGFSSETLSFERSCAMGMAAVWEAWTELGARALAVRTADGKLPPQVSFRNSQAALLMSTIAPLVDELSLSDSARLLLSSMLSGPDAQQGVGPHNLPLDVLATFLHAFGLAGQPELGEALLSEWATFCASAEGSGTASEGGSAETFVRTAILPSSHSLLPPLTNHTRVPHDLDPCADILLSGWSHSVQVWTTLVRARTVVGDLHGARLWLERYRIAVAAQLSEIDATSPRWMHYRRPHASPNPYVAYMQGCAMHLPAPSVGALANGENYAMDSGGRTIAEVLRVMRKDNLPLTEGTIRIVLAHEAMEGRLQSASELMMQAIETAWKEAITADGVFVAGSNETSNVVEARLPAQITHETFVAQVARSFPSHLFASLLLLQAARARLPPSTAHDPSHSISQIMPPALLPHLGTPRDILKMLLAAHHQLTAGKPSKPSRLLTPRILNHILAAALAQPLPYAPRRVAAPGYDADDPESPTAVVGPHPRTTLVEGVPAPDLPCALVALQTFDRIARQTNERTEQIIQDGLMARGTWTFNEAAMREERERRSEIARKTRKWIRQVAERDGLEVEETMVRSGPVEHEEETEVREALIGGEEEGGDSDLAERHVASGSKSMLPSRLLTTLLESAIESEIDLGIELSLADRGRRDRKQSEHSQQHLPLAPWVRETIARIEALNAGDPNVEHPLVTDGLDVLGLVMAPARARIMAGVTVRGKDSPNFRM